MTSHLCPRCARPISQPGPCGVCQLDVPAQWLTEQTVSIAMTGARSTGKSVLIAVMMLTFEHFLAERHSSFLEPLGNTREKFRLFYMEPLYVERALIKPTPPRSNQPLEPLLWSFAMGGRRYCLSLTDAAGEDFEKVSPSDDHFRYLATVDLIVSLISMLKVPPIAVILDGLVNFPGEAGDDLAVLRQVLTARRAHRGSATNPQSATALSKFDVVQRLREVEQALPWHTIMNRPGAAMMRDPSMASAFDDQVDSDLLQSEISGLLELMGATMLQAAAQEAQMPFRLFACSALGMPPSADAVNRGGITPFRVLDVIKAAVAIKGGRQ